MVLAEKSANIAHTIFQTTGMQNQSVIPVELE